jgi:hypothetical protein
MILRRFTEEGTNQFSALMQSRPVNVADQSQLFDNVEALLHDERYSIGSYGEIDLPAFVSRKDLAFHLWSYLGPGGKLKVPNLGDPHLWNWLSAAWIRTLTTHDPTKKLEKEVGDFRHWVLIENVRRAHWHVVSHPFFVLQANQDNLASADAFLASDVLHPGELVDKIGSNRAFLKPPISTLVTYLYLEPTKNYLRKGFSTRTDGGPNQLSKFLGQIDRTVDYESLSIDEILDLLPAQFAKWVLLAKATRALETT